MCDTSVVVLPDRVLFAKSSDRDPNEAQALDWQPARLHPSGATVQCTHITIPEARETRAVLLSRPFWMWGAEMGANDAGVVAGNEAVFTSEAVPRAGALTGMDLLRLALERSESAAQAVEVAIALHERHGQGGRMGHEDPSFRYWSSFLFADAREAWVLETAGRHATATERVRSGARSISNGLSIAGFADGRRDRLRTHFARAEERRACTTRRASNARSAGDMFALLRDHGQPGAPALHPVPSWDLLTGAMRAPCMHAGGLVASSQSVASWVAELAPSGARHWVTATAAPCTSIFKPVRVDQPLELGPWPSDRFDAAALFWRHELLHRRALRAPVRAANAFHRERDAVEARWLASPPDPRDAFAEADAMLERWAGATRGLPETRPTSVAAKWRRWNARAELTL